MLYKVEVLFKILQEKSCDNIKFCKNKNQDLNNCLVQLLEKNRFSYGLAGKNEGFQNEL